MAVDLAYCPRHPEDSPLYAAVAGHLETFLARQRERDRPIRGFVEREFREFLNVANLAGDLSKNSMPDRSHGQLDILRAVVTHFAQREREGTQRAQN
jgi:hypothetical protein